MSPLRIENPREPEEERPQLTRWQIWQDRFWEWVYLGSFTSQARRPKEIKSRFRKASVIGLYADLISGEISALDLYEELEPVQVDEFIALHQKTRAEMNGEEDADIPMELSLVLTRTFIKDHRRLVFAIQQVDNIIDNLAVEVQKRSTGGNVVRRED